MDKKKLQQIIIILPILFIAGVFGYYKYLLSPLREKEKTLASELDQIKKEYNESVGRIGRLPQLQQEILLLNQEIGEVQKKLPPNKDMPYLIRLLSKKMAQFEIIWNRLSPGAQSVKEYYIEHSYTIPFRTSYHNLASFLTELGQMERIFASRFSNLNSETSPDGTIVITGDLTFLIYTSK